MLSLHCPTPDRWFAQVNAQRDELLIDHAHCEKKAAGVAMGLLFVYVDNTDLCRAMMEIVREELEHFGMVLDLLRERGIAFRKLLPSQYGERLNRLVRKGEPNRAVDRLLVAGLIEARSCERFAILRDRLDDPELATFYGNLFESEARHHAAYVKLAKEFAPAEEVTARLHELAEAEAELVRAGEELPRVHS